ncbi:DnaD domain-containing protein [Streptococcus parauberis]|uniref:DnaD domain-containing protein n=1 Tax=Streptococcus parauberis TaxID=1348 RepID=UPI003798E671
MDKKTLFENFQKNWMRLISPFEIEDIEKWIDEDNMPVEVINEALKETVIYNAKNTRYLNRVLNNWKANGIDTVEKVEISRLEFENKKQGKYQKQTGSNIPSWSNPDYKDPDFLDFALGNNYE